MVFIRGVCKKRMSVQLTLRSSPMENGEFLEIENEPESCDPGIARLVNETLCRRVGRSSIQRDKFLNFSERQECDCVTVHCWRGRTTCFWAIAFRVPSLPLLVTSGLFGSHDHEILRVKVKIKTESFRGSEKRGFLNKQALIKCHTTFVLNNFDWTNKTNKLKNKCMTRFI